jgi:hypothetical protein
MDQSDFEPGSSTVLKDPNDNPYYLLATIYGEQTSLPLNEELAMRNRQAWISWMGQSDGSAHPEIKAAFRNRVGQRSISLPVRGSVFLARDCLFTKPLDMRNFTLFGIEFSNCTFNQPSISPLQTPEVQLSFPIQHSRRMRDFKRHNSLGRVQFGVPNFAEQLSLSMRRSTTKQLLKPTSALC